MKSTTNVFAALLTVIGFTSHATPKAAKITYVSKPVTELLDNSRYTNSSNESLSDKIIDLHNNKTELIHNDQHSTNSKSFDRNNLQPSHQIAEGLNYNGLDKTKERLTSFR